MNPGHQWIHFDAQFPLGFGHDITERFGPAGQLLFVQFLCACKRSFPQGQIQYRTEEEARVTLAAHYPFVDNSGATWTLDAFWKWCGRKAKTRTTTRNGRTTVHATRWEAWEDANKSKNAERMRRSRAKSVRARAGLRGEVGGVRGEVGGVRGEGGSGGAGTSAVGTAGTAAVQILEKLKQQQPNGNGHIQPGPCRRCGFLNCECPLEPHQVSEVLRASGWRREGEEGEWIPPSP